MGWNREIRPADRPRLQLVSGSFCFLSGSIVVLPPIDLTVFSI